MACAVKICSTLEYKHFLPVAKDLFIDFIHDYKKNFKVLHILQARLQVMFTIWAKFNGLDLCQPYLLTILKIICIQSRKCSCRATTFDSNCKPPDGARQQWDRENGTRLLEFDVLRPVLSVLLETPNQRHNLMMATESAVFEDSGVGRCCLNSKLGLTFNNFVVVF